MSVPLGVGGGVGPQVNKFKQVSSGRFHVWGEWVGPMSGVWGEGIDAISGVWGWGIGPMPGQGGHGTGKTGNLILDFSRQGKHREFCCDTGKIFETQGKKFDCTYMLYFYVLLAVLV